MDGFKSRQSRIPRLKAQGLAGGVINSTPVLGETLGTPLTLCPRTKTSVLATAAPKLKQSPAQVKRLILRPVVDDMKG
jgi:hypothetical protein